eukprot:1158491-Pelagomonas_calceolata.AAC.5
MRMNGYCEGSLGSKAKALMHRSAVMGEGECSATTLWEDATQLYFLLSMSHCGTFPASCASRCATVSCKMDAGNEHKPVPAPLASCSSLTSQL